MKFSASILNDSYLASKIFDTGLEKAKHLLNEIFPKTVENDVEKNEYFYAKEFTVDGRHIKAVFNFELNEEGMLQEILSICEMESEKVAINQTHTFEDAINLIESILEEKYSINLLPLDPDDPDNIVLKMNKDNNQLTWYAKIKMPFYEGYAEIYYNDNDKSYFKVVHNKIYKIIFD